jgi:hypothetical protein
VKIYCSALFIGKLALACLFVGMLAGILLFAR